MSTSTPTDSDETLTPTDKRIGMINGLTSPPTLPMKTTKGTERTHQYPIHDDDVTEDLFVYSLPHKDFHYNVDNTRILSQRWQWEAENPGKVLSPIDNVEDIEKMLLDNPAYGDTTTKDLTDSIKGRAYLKEPILISEDGVVWNGNRRLAIIRKLLKDDYDVRYEKVPVCVLEHLEFNDLKALEGRLQVKKTYKAEYGTIDIRCRIEQARQQNRTWEQIETELGKPIDKLKKMQRELGLVNTWMENLGRPMDYKLAQKTGIDIFVTAETHIKAEEDALMPAGNAAQQDPVLFSKIKMAWLQNLSLPDATHDNIRKFRDIMLDTEARADYLKNDNVYNNYTTLTRKMITGTDGFQHSAVFDPAELAATVKNRDAAATIVESKEPDKKAARALQHLESIKDEKIDANMSADFKTTIDNIKKRVTKIGELMKGNAQ
jgi:hypothetical protein